MLVTYSFTATAVTVRRCIVETARRFGPDRPFTRDDDARLTKDATRRIALMLDLVRDLAALDHEYLRPWLERAGHEPASSA